MLTRYPYAMALCPSVLLSQVGVYQNISLRRQRCTIAQRDSGYVAHPLSHAYVVKVAISPKRYEIETNGKSCGLWNDTITIDIE